MMTSMDNYREARQYLDDQGWGSGSSATDAMNQVQQVAEGNQHPSSTELLAALVVLRQLRDDLARWEPALITAARELGTSWAAIAPALGLASRQAAERRYLRLSPLPSGTSGAEDRVREVRDRRAADRAVSDWARKNSAVLRQLAGQIIGLPGMRPRKLAAALSEDDPIALLAPLTAVRERLRGSHPELADRIGALTDQADQLRTASNESRSRDS
ncbi:HSP18 transcriptional regulator [Kibdelosporangium philippinense]|uniref:HSP18 transcriptional regulator n=1 Tax=Kibdelosporangium philippinense TaxID=211113 RepID=A0ABS8ZPY7_9PSEU|nr:HSP18 transcriptional regulator [Kibdelosporangium philippinense]MCE7009811.1 HSP18 transcriptional regulator [Kibdelosporangium philippinense]